MKIEIEVKGVVKEEDILNSEKRRNPDTYKDGFGLYAIMTDSNVSGFIMAEHYSQTQDGKQTMSTYDFRLGTQAIASTAVSKNNEQLAVCFSEAINKINDIVSTEKANQKACLEHIENMLKEIADNRGNGISEKTLLEALKIVRNKEGE